MRVLPALFITLALGPAATAAEIPRIDADADCRQSAMQPGRRRGTVQDAYESCFTSLQRQFTELRDVWATIPEPIQEDCLRRFDPKGAVPYYDLRTCVVARKAGADEARARTRQAEELAQQPRRELK